MEVEGVMLSEISQETREPCVLSYEEIKEKRELYLKAQHWFPAMLKSACRVKRQEGREKECGCANAHYTCMLVSHEPH